MRAKQASPACLKMLDFSFVLYNTQLFLGPSLVSGGPVRASQVRLPDVTAFQGCLDLKSRFGSGGSSPSKVLRCPTLLASVAPLPSRHV